MDAGYRMPDAGYRMLNHRQGCLCHRHRVPSIMIALSLMIAFFLLIMAYGVWMSEARCLPISQVAMPVPPRGQQVILTTVDGIRIRAFEIATGKDTMLIYCHRLLSSKESFDLAGFGSVFLREFDVLALDFRGHKGSGWVSNCGGDEVLDLRAAIQYARETGHRKIVLLGVGMGGVAAIREAALFGNADAVVAVSPAGQPEKLKPWWWNLLTDVSLTTDYGKIPIRILISARITGRYWTGSPVYLVDRVSPTPLLLVHGQGDRYLNGEQIQKLYDDAREPKKLLVLPRSEHAEGLLDESTAELMITWLKEVLSEQPSVTISEIPPTPFSKGGARGLLLPSKRGARGLPLPSKGGARELLLPSKGGARAGKDGPRVRGGCFVGTSFLALKRLSLNEELHLDWCGLRYAEAVKPAHIWSYCCSSARAGLITSIQCRSYSHSRRISPMNGLLTRENLPLQAVFPKRSTLTRGAGQLLLSYKEGVWRLLPFPEGRTSTGSDTNSPLQSPIPISYIEIHGDIVLPEKMIEEAIRSAAGGASDLQEQLTRIKRDVEALHRTRGYMLSEVFEVRLSEDGRLWLGIEVGQIDRLIIDGNRQVPSEQIQQVLQIAAGHYYNAWETETAVKRLSRFPVFANVESQLKQGADGNAVRILVKERRPWSLGVASHFTDFDKFGGLQFSVNEFRSGAWRGYSEILLGLQHRRPLYRVNLEKGWFGKEAFSVGLGFERFIYSWDSLDYYFARQEARRQGGDVNAAYKITDNATIHLGLYRKHFSALDWDKALPADSGVINALTLRLENRGRFLRRGEYFLNWHSQTFMETATTRAHGDYGYTVFQFNVYPQLVLSPTQTLNLGLHWGYSRGGVPQQKLFSLGGDRTLPGYDDDSFVGEHVFLLRARYDLKWGKWLRETSRLAPLGVNFLLDAGDARMKSKSLRFDAPKLELGVELNYASVIRLGLVKSLGKEREAACFYFGWHPHLVRP